MNLRNFAQIIEADEVLLFERATFLVNTAVLPSGFLAWKTLLLPEERGCLAHCLDPGSVILEWLT